MKRFIIVLFLLFLFPVTARAQDTVQDALNQLNSGNLDTVIQQNPDTANLSFGDLAAKAVSGQLDLSPAALAGDGLHLLFGSFSRSSGLIRNILLIALLSAIVTVLTDSFKTKAAGALGFYVCYLALVTAVFAAFQSAATVLTSLVGNLSDLMIAALPVLMGALAMSGSVGGAYAFHPMLLFMVNIVTMLIRAVFVPVAIAGAAVQIVSYLLEKNPLSRLALLVKKSLDWGLKGVCFLLVTVLTLQKMTLPLVDNLAVRTAKAGAGAVPVIGGVLSGAMDTVLSLGGAAKGGVMAAILILLAAACAVPVLNILALAAVFKGAAALVQPVADERIAKCLDDAAGYTGLLLSGAVVAAVLFILSVVILLSF